MAHTVSNEEKQLSKLIGKLPISAEERQALAARVMAGEMGEELAEELKSKIVALEDADVRGRWMAELARAVQQWRFAAQKRHFRR